MNPIFLIGFMGSGKSTLGRALGRMSALQYIDLDSYIENRFHSTVSALFAERGEQGFRDLERRMLHELAEFEDIIIGCGGGTPCFFDNMDYMNSHGTTVWLEAPLPVLVGRLIRNRRNRPLLADLTDAEIEQKVVEMLGTRGHDYAKAKHRFDGTALEDREMVTQSAQKFITEFNLPQKQ